MSKFQLYKDRKSEYRWRFRAGNGQIIADSAEGYVRKIDCQAGINLIKRQAPTAPVEDLTVRQAAHSW